MDREDIWRNRWPLRRPRSNRETWMRVGQAVLPWRVPFLAFALVDWSFTACYWRTWAAAQRCEGWLHEFDERTG